MRDLVVHAWTSADGFSADEGTEVMQRMGEIDDPAFDELFAGRLAGAGTHIMGRVTYLEMAGFWPKSSHVNAAPMNDIPKVVFSRTLRGASWRETRIASGDTAQEIARLKAEPGHEIIAHGGTQFVRSLVRLGLVDRYRLYLVPVATGAGVPLFTADAHPGRLRLEHTTAYPGGILELVYAPARPGEPSGPPPADTGLAG
jgi:dihydrofolate reductase